MTVKERFKTVFNILLRSLIGVAVMLFITLVIVLFNQLFEMIGSQAVFGFILFVISGFCCYGIGCSIYPMKGNKK